MYFCSDGKGSITSFCPTSCVQVIFAQKAVSKFLLPKKLSKFNPVGVVNASRKFEMLLILCYLVSDVCKQTATPTDKLKTFYLSLEKDASLLL